MTIDFLSRPTALKTGQGGYYTEPGLALGPQALAMGQAYAGGKAVYFSAYDQASRTCALAYDLQAGELAVGQRVAVVGASGSEVCGVGTVAGFDVAANTVTLSEDVLGAGGDGVDGYLVWAAAGQGAQAFAAGQGCVAAATNAVALGGWNTVLAQNALAAGIYNLVEAAGNAGVVLGTGNRVLEHRSSNRLALS
jgi:hypothetical protein